MERVLSPSYADKVVYSADATDDRGLRFNYGGYTMLTQWWCHDHARMVDFLAVIQVGYRLGGATLLGADPGHAEATAFAKAVYDRLNKTTKLDHVLAAIAALTRVSKWLDQGFIPLDLLEGVAEDFGVGPRSKLVKFLSGQGIVAKVEPRKVKDPMERSVRSAILTSEGKKRLAERSPTTPRLYQGTDETANEGR